MQLSGIEVYARVVTACEALALLESLRNQSAATAPLFNAVMANLVMHFELDRQLSALMPYDDDIRTPLEKRMQTNKRCFGELHARLLQRRDELLPWLLIRTYRDHPPTAVEAFRYLRLEDVQRLLDKLSAVLNYGTRQIDRGEYYDRDDFIRDQQKQVEFLLDQLGEYGISADTYAEAVQEYVKLVDSVFPAAAARKSAPSDVVATVSCVPIVVRR